MKRVNAKSIVGTGPKDVILSFPAMLGVECAGLLRRIDRVGVMEAPNSMNKYGRVLGPEFDGIVKKLVDWYVRPSAELIYGVRLAARPHAFVVDYSTKTQRSLQRHVDGPSKVTLNLCLGRRFKGGSLVFYDAVGGKVEVDHRVGTAIVHGGHHEHRATALESGSRRNLIIWCA